MSFIYQEKQYRKSTETDDKNLAKGIFNKIKGEIVEGKGFERLPVFREFENRDKSIGRFKGCPKWSGLITILAQWRKKSLPDWEAFSVST